MSSTTEEVMQRLAALGATDRQWILERLPPQAKMRLAEHIEDRRVEAAAVPVSTAGFEWERAVERLRAADAEQIARSLQGEPVWLVSAVLNAADWPWTRNVLRNLSAPLRLELVSVDRRGPALSRPAMEVLIIEMARRAAEWPVAAVPSSRLGTLMQWFRRRSHR